MKHFWGRGPNKIQNSYVIKDFYKEYLKEVEDNKLYLLSYNDYKEIINTYFKEVVDLLLNDSVAFKFPSHIGIFQITKKKGIASKILNNPNTIDWENTHKYGKIVRYTNDHSDGYRYFFTWFRNTSPLKNITKYRFIPSRTNKRKLGYYIKNKIKDYFEVIDKRK